MTGDVIGNKIADKITKVSEHLPKNNSEINEEEIFKPSELRHKVFDDLRLKEKNY